MKRFRTSFKLQNLLVVAMPTSLFDIISNDVLDRWNTRIGARPAVTDFQ